MNANETGGAGGEAASSELLPRLRAAASELREALIAAGRLRLATLLAERTIDARAAEAGHAETLLRAAVRLEEWLAERAARGASGGAGSAGEQQTVVWNSALAAELQRLFSLERIEPAPLARLAEREEQRAFERLESISASVRGLRTGEPWRAMLEELRTSVRSFPLAHGSPPLAQEIAQMAQKVPIDAAASADGAAPPAGEHRDGWNANPRAVRAIRGPQSASLDARLCRSESLLDSMSSYRGVPELWLMAMQEDVTALLCALSSVEHDGLPLRFHQDLARQAADEERHARFFFATADELLPAFVASAPADHPALEGARRHLAGEMHALPVPREAALYESFWSCSLFERLVLMHDDGEGVAVDRFQSELDRHSPLFASRRDELALVMADEESHAALGARWLEHLEPDPARRESELRRVTLMRGVLLSLGMLATHPSGAGLLDLLAAKGSAPRA